MRTALLLALVVSVGCSATGQGDEVRAYINAKARYDTQTKGGLSREGVETALHNLEARMRQMLGSDLVPTWKQRFTLTWFPCCDPGGRVLDGLLLEDTGSRASMVVTVPGILDAWLEQIGEKATDPLVGLSREDALTWAFGGDAHVYLFADLSASTMPPGVFLAQLVARTNGDPMTPDEVVVGVKTGRRIYVMIAPAVVHLDLTSQCGTAGDDEYRPCFRRLAPSHPDFSRLSDQARGLAGLATVRP